MDERQFQKTYAEFNDRPCVFAKAVLRRCCGCARAQRLYIAEREAVGCRSPGGQERCQTLSELLHEKARFALHLTQAEPVLPHAKEMKVQCGGLLGLARALWDNEADRVDDVHALLDDALSRWGGLDALPYAAVMPAIVHYQARKRAGS